MNEPCYKNCNSIKFWSEYSNKKNEELHTTKRALWLARAMRAKDKYTTYMHFWDGYDEEDLNFILWKKWQWVERKCREKAEEYL